MSQPNTFIDAFRWYEDDNSTAVTAQDTDPTDLQLDQDYVLRVRIYNNGAKDEDAATYQLQANNTTQVTDWFNVTTSSTHVQATDVSGLVDTTAITAGTLTGATGTWRNGEEVEDGVSGSQDLLSGYYTEFWWSVRLLSANVNSGDNIDFQIIPGHDTGAAVPSATAKQTVDIALVSNSLTITAAAPTVDISDNISIVGVSNQLTLSSSAPTIDLTGNVILNVPIASITLTGAAPTVDVSDNIAITIPPASQTLEDPEFDDASKWTVDADFAVHDGVLEGYGSDSSNLVYPDYYHTLAAGKVYRVEYEISSHTQGGFYFAIGSASTPTRTTTGTWVDYITTVSASAPLVVSTNYFIGVVEYCRVTEVNFSGKAPTVDISTSAIDILIPQGALTLIGNAPTVDVTNDIDISVPQGALTLTGYAPTPSLTNDVDIQLIVNNLTLTGAAPTLDVTAHVPIDLIVNNLTITGETPVVDVTADVPIAVPQGALTLTGNAPTLDVGAGVNIDVPVSNLTLTGAAPTIDLTGHVIKAVPKAELTLTGYNPNLSIGDNVDIGIPSGNLTITGNVPVIDLTGHVILAVPKAGFFRWFADKQRVLVTHHVPLYPPVGNLTLTGSAPTVDVTNDVNVTVPQTNLTLVANNPDIDLTGNVAKRIPKAELTLVSFNPTVDAPGSEPEVSPRGLGASGGGTGRKYKKALREENVKQSKKKAGKPRIGRLEDVVLPAPKYEAEVQEALNEVVAEVIQQDKPEYEESGLSLEQVTAAIVSTTKALEQERFRALVEETQTIVANIRQQIKQKREADKREELAIQKARAQAEEIAREELRAAIEAEKIALLKRKQEEEDLIAILYILDDVA